jgi:tRNA(fMet)-specific endonuclease VapC
VNYLLDTNVLLAYLRYGPLGAFIDQTYQLSGPSTNLIVTVVVEGEIRALAMRLKWGSSRTAEVTSLLARMIVVPLPFLNIVQAYAEIDTFSLNRGAVMGKNDLWIAATAHVVQARLLTADHDFDHLDGQYPDRHYIDPTSAL